MSRRYTYFFYEGNREPEVDEFGHDPWRRQGEIPFSRLPWWFEHEARMGSALVWIGAAFFGLGLLIILFPMLLVFAIAGIFFTVGAVCFSIWWRLRGHAHKVKTGPSWWERTQDWFRARFE